MEVDDVEGDYKTMIASGGKSAFAPKVIEDRFGKGSYQVAEVYLYGDVVLRLMNLKGFSGNFLPNYEDVALTKETVSIMNQSRPLGSKTGWYGIYAIDHIVGNVWKLAPTLEFIKGLTGFHEFAEFDADDVGTVDSGLNSVVLANANERILLPINEPTFGTKRKSQIQTYLEQNKGEGVQHIAMFSRDIFYTIEAMRRAAVFGGLELLDPPHDGYYQNARKRLGDSLTDEQYALIEKYGILADKDQEGVLLQIFTKPLGDRPTVFIEIIQRVGCQVGEYQKPGCGGFGKVSHTSSHNYTFL